MPGELDAERRTLNGARTAEPPLLPKSYRCGSRGVIGRAVTLTPHKEAGRYLEALRPQGGCSPCSPAHNSLLTKL